MATDESGGMTPRRGASARERARSGRRASLAFANGCFSLALVVAASLLAARAVHAAEPKGDALFATHCAACHGIDGEAGGPVADVMKISMPNLRTLAKRNRGVFPVDAVTAYIDGRNQVASHGDRLMPVWGDFLQTPGDNGDQEPVRARIAEIVAFIQRLQYR
jgi:mono/diheme cytochrome c family protein